MLFSFFQLVRRYFPILLIWILIGCGVFLRSFRADKFPINNNDDGLFYVWTGNSFFKNPMQTTSHSIFVTNNQSLIWWAQYKDLDPINRFAMKITRPWFDHPPLATVFIAFPAMLLGYTDIQQLPHMLVRYPALLASIATMLLTFLLAREWFGKKIAYFTLLFLATTPYIVFAQRQSYLENFLIPTFLASLYFLCRWTETKKRGFFIASLILAAITGWMKIPAFSFPFMVGGWLLVTKHYKQGFQYIGAGIISAALYFGYGFFVDKSAFLWTLSNQGGRGAFPSSFLVNVIKPEFYQPFIDGWYIFSIIAALAVSLSTPQDNQKRHMYAWFFCAWLLALFLVSGPLNNSPWYKYPLIPFYAMAIGVFAQKLWDEYALWIAAPFFVFGVTGFDAIKIDISSTILRFATIGIAGIFVLPLLLHSQRWKMICGKCAAALLITGIVALNIVVALRYPFLFCEETYCQKSERFVIEEKL